MISFVDMNLILLICQFIQGLFLQSAFSLILFIHVIFFLLSEPCFAVAACRLTGVFSDRSSFILLFLNGARLPHQGSRISVDDCLVVSIFCLSVCLFCKLPLFLSLALQTVLRFCFSLLETFQENRLLQNKHVINSINHWDYTIY